MIDELAGGEDGRHEIEAVHHHVERLEQPDHVLGGVAAAPRRLIDPLELALGDVAVIALELLLGGELLAIVGRLAALAAVLAGG